MKANNEIFIIDGISQIKSLDIKYNVICFHWMLYAEFLITLFYKRWSIHIPNLYNFGPTMKYLW